jgi:hypothetical protein
MTLRTDPDDLSQGAITAPAGVTFTVGSPLDEAVITSAATLPVIIAGEFFEIRDHSNGQNNGLYQEVGGSPTTSSVTARKISGANPITAASETITWLGNSASSPESTNQKSIHIATGDRDIYILEQGLVDPDGVTEQALYSFLKEEWKDDNTLIPFVFPMVAITPEQYEFSENWNPADDENASPATFRTRKLIRTGGWSELDTDGQLIKQYIGAITLGSFVEATDRSYYQQGNDPTDTGAAVDFDFDGPVNESVLVYNRVVNNGGGAGLGLDFGTDTITRNDGGSWITDGVQVGGQITVSNCTGTSPVNDGTFNVLAVTASIVTVTAASFTATGSPNERTADVAVDNRNSLRVFLREGFSVALDPDSGKTYAQADLDDIGVTVLTNQVYRFPLANSADLKVLNSDAVVSTRSPTVTIEYFGTAQVISGFNADGASTQSPQTDAAFGIVIDAKGLSLEFVYEFVQYQLRQAANINDNVLSPGNDIVTGRTADELLAFVGDALGSLASSNPSGGGTGVTIINFNAADTNRLSFVDNDGLTRTFPFVAAGNIFFNENLQNDTGPATFSMFFQYTTRTAVSDMTLGSIVGSQAILTSTAEEIPSNIAVGEYIALSGFTDPNNNGVWLVQNTTFSPQSASVTLLKYDSTLTLTAEGPVSGNVDENPIDSPDAIIVNSDSTFSPLPITGIVAGASVSYDFDYDGNDQGGRTAGTDANVAVRAIGTDLAQFVETTGTIQRSTTNDFTLVAPLERNFSNP